MKTEVAPKNSLALDPAETLSAPQQRDSTFAHLLTALLYTIVTVVLLGVIYPLGMTAVAQLIFPHQAEGSILYVAGKPVASGIIGQQWSKPIYFQGRPSAAGKGYDPTSTGGTNLAPTAKKLIDTTKATITALRKANPDATIPLPMDLVTSSASGIDPDISPEGAKYQVPRVAKARGMSVAAVQAIVDAHVRSRDLGFLGEPHVNVTELNFALDKITPANTP